jgi:hypothetical protein
MKNREVYERDVDTFSLENQGVAKVDEALDAQQQATLRFELETFVCRGHYEEGLRRILDGFLETVPRGHDAPAAWVSGFFGSGKSHLVKMARALWTDVPFATDGRTPRDIARLPRSVADPLRELDTLVRQRKTVLKAAAGTLSQGAGDSIRKAVLGIVFKAMGLPATYDQARAVLWLRNEGIEEAVRAALGAAGRSLEHELQNLYVSSLLHEAILRAKPTLARDPFELGDKLEHQFLTRGDISQDDFLQFFGEAVAGGGPMPVFLLVLDELQQYIAGSQDRALRVHEVVESLSKGLQGRVLVVATGQSALSGTPTLSKLLGRFPIPVQLSDADVEEVLRETVLKKRPSASPPLAELFSPARALGEVSAHLRDSQFAHRREDEAVLPANYPLLPTRQRLWERVLATTDTTGTGVQLRSQLRIAFEAVRKTKDEPLGHLVGGDFLYDEIRMRLRQASQISAETANAIDRLDGAGSPAAALKARVLKAVFLMTRVTGGGQDTGLRTDAQSIADVLVDDLTRDSAPVRADVRAALAELVDHDRLLMRVAEGALEEYRLQTRESADWFAYLRGEEAALQGDPAAYETRIREELTQLAGDRVRRLTVVQGTAKEVRRLHLHTDPVTPPKASEGLAVWLRSDLDGTTAREVAQDAARAGLTVATVFAHVAFADKGALVKAVVSREAAQRTLDHKGQPVTPEGQEARSAVAKQRDDADGAVKRLLAEALAQTEAYQGGGQRIEEGETLEDRLKRAAADGAARLYSQFGLADAVGWDRALIDAEKGKLDALQRVGHAGGAETHPAARELLARIGAGAIKGGKLREELMSPPYGWSQDGVDALLAVLFVGGQLRAVNASGSPWPAGRFSRRDVNTSTFARESAPLSNDEKRAIARLVKCKPDEAEARAPEFLARLRDAYDRATGAAPRPARREDPLFQELTGLSGRDLVKRLAEEESAARALLDGLEAQAAKVATREPGWAELTRLLPHLDGLPDGQAIRIDRDAVLAGRMLLADPDPVASLVSRAGDALRAALVAAYGDYARAFEAVSRELAGTAEWGKLAEADHEAVLRETHLASPDPAPATGTLDELVTSLEQCPIARWHERRDALRGQLDRARTLVARTLEPQVQPVVIPRRLLRTEAELDLWLDEVRTAVRGKLGDGPVQV